MVVKRLNIAYFYVSVRNFYNDVHAIDSGSTSPRQLTKVECKTCPWVICSGVLEEAQATALGCTSVNATGPVYGIRLKSSGGQVTSCSCPEGFHKVAHGSASCNTDYDCDISFDCQPDDD